MARGRKGIYEALRPIETGWLGKERPQPPETMSQAERLIWHDYVDGMPAGWFGRESQSLLRLLCRHTVLLEDMTQRLVDADPNLTGRIKELVALIDKEAKIVTNLAWHLRLTPKSRSEVQRKDETGTRVTRKPWDDEAA